MVCFDFCFRAGSEKEAQRWRQKGTVRKPKCNFMIIQDSKKTYKVQRKHTGHEHSIHI